MKESVQINKEELNNVLKKGYYDNRDDIIIMPFWGTGRDRFFIAFNLEGGNVLLQGTSYRYDTFSDVDRILSQGGGEKPYLIEKKIYQEDTDKLNANFLGSMPLKIDSKYKSPAEESFFSMQRL